MNKEQLKHRVDRGIRRLSAAKPDWHKPVHELASTTGIDVANPGRCPLWACFGSYLQGLEALELSYAFSIPVFYGFNVAESNCIEDMMKERDILNDLWKEAAAQCVNADTAASHEV